MDEVERMTKKVRCPNCFDVISDLKDHLIGYNVKTGMKYYACKPCK